ncbi:far upstream element-binding protein 1 [Panicum miliaceum]|uniref:Far upstream element-binding protein 1 n=1 Tax=Panicum miliaceum TaxID=4540 RepID=A0A3L6SXJ2_PANMI|nr:far upstream element-binding protein 1 [Panicum miliaceum]
MSTGRLKSRKVVRVEKEKLMMMKVGKPINGDSTEDYVRLICGACTHWRQLKMNVDGFIRGNHPTVISDLKNILETSDIEDSSQQMNQAGGYGPQGWAPGSQPYHSQSTSYPSGPRNYNGDVQYDPGNVQPPYPHHEPQHYYDFGYDGQQSQPYHSQSTSYPCGPGNYNGDVQYDPGYVQPPYPHHEPQHYYGFGYDGQQSQPSHSQSPSCYGELPMAPQQGYPQWAPTVAMAPYGLYPAPPHAFYEPVFQQSFAYGQTYGAVMGPYVNAEQNYPQQGGWQYPVVSDQRAPVAPGYPHGYGSTAPAAGVASLPAAGQPAHGQAGSTQTPTILSFRPS